MRDVLTVEPLGVVLDGPLEGELSVASREVVQVCSEDDRISLGEFRVGS